MHIELLDKPFEATIIENITIRYEGEDYQAEVEIQLGVGLDEPEIDVTIVAHGLSNDTIDTIKEEITEKFSNYTFNRSL